MTDIQVLELFGTDGAASLAFGHALLESLVPLEPGPQPKLRALEYSPATPGLDWVAVKRLHGRVYKILFNDVVVDRLRRHRQVVLDVTGAPRDLASTLAALHAQAQTAQPMVALDVTVPEAVDVDALFDTWRRILDPLPSARRITRLPPSAMAASAADQVLDQLLDDTARFLDSETVGRHLSGNPEHATPRIVTSRARKAGRLIGVWDGNAFRYPGFQFDEHGRPLKRLPDLIGVLPTDADGSFRNAALWLFAPDGALGDRSPAEVFPIDPDRVIALRRHRLSTDSMAE